MLLEEHGVNYKKTGSAQKTFHIGLKQIWRAPRLPRLQRKVINFIVAIRCPNIRHSRLQSNGCSIPRDLQTRECIAISLLKRHGTYMYHHVPTSNLRRQCDQAHSWIRFGVMSEEALHAKNMRRSSLYETSNTKTQQSTRNSSLHLVSNIGMLSAVLAILGRYSWYHPKDQISLLRNRLKNRL